MIDTLKAAELIAPFLDGWRFNRVLSDPENWRPVAVMTNDARQQFKITTDWRNDKRLKVYGDNSRHSITVSPERHPQAIAGDIARRFLPDFLADVAEHAQRTTERENKAEEKRLKLAILEKILGDFKLDAHRGDHFFRGGSLSFNYDETVTISVRLAFDDSVRLAHCIRGLINE